MKTRKERIHIDNQYCAGPLCDCGYKSTKPQPTPKAEESAGRHTPGPWTVSEITKKDSELRSLVGNAIEGWVIAGIYKHPKLQFNGKEYVHTNTTDRKTRADADARLIAAAPELLEALKNAREYVEQAYSTKGTTLLGVLGQIDKAIAKAEGSQAPKGK